ILERVSERLGGSAGRRRRIILCPVPHCGKPGGGPKWGWFCAEHRNLPKAEMERIRRERRARLASAAPARRSKRAAGEKERPTARARDGASVDRDVNAQS